MTTRFLAFLAAVLGMALVCAGQPPEPQVRAKRDALEKQVMTAFNAHDLEKAEKLLREWIELRPMEFVPVYNLACVLAMKKQEEPACEQLLKAVELGFTDRRVILTDENLTSIRETKTYRDLLASWPKVLDHVIDAREARAKAAFSKKYTFQRDSALRLAYASGFEAAAFGSAREEITRLAKWWQTEVLPEGTAGVVIEGEAPDPWVMVILPTKQDFVSWAAKNFGSRDGKLSRVGGVYDNDKKELVAGDLSASFKHEFMHVLHWRHNNRMGQVHPIWVQEGLCSLVEDTKLEGERVVPVPSWRTNSLKRRAASSKVSIEAMLKMPREKFSGTTPLANYALARAAFLYLSDKGKLREWYGAYCAGFDAEPSGKDAFEKVLGKPIAQIDKEFRIWLAKLPDGPEYSEPEEEGR